MLTGTVRWTAVRRTAFRLALRDESCRYHASAAGGKKVSRRVGKTKRKTKAETEEGTENTSVKNDQGVQSHENSQKLENEGREDQVVTSKRNRAGLTAESQTVDRLKRLQSAEYLRSIYFPQSYFAEPEEKSALPTVSELERSSPSREASYDRKRIVNPTETLREAEEYRDSGAAAGAPSTYRKASYISRGGPHTQERMIDRTTSRSEAEKHESSGAVAGAPSPNGKTDYVYGGQSLASRGAPHAEGMKINPTSRHWQREKHRSWTSAVRPSPYQKLSVTHLPFQESKSLYSELEWSSDFAPPELLSELKLAVQKRNWDKIQEIESKVFHGEKPISSLFIPLMEAYAMASDYNGASRVFWKIAEEQRSLLVLLTWLRTNLLWRNCTGTKAATDLLFQRHIRVPEGLGMKVVDLFFEFRKERELYSFINQQSSLHGKDGSPSFVETGISNMLTRFALHDRHDYGSYLLMDLLSRGCVQITPLILEGAVRCMEDEPDRIEAMIEFAQRQSLWRPTEATWEVLARSYQVKGDLFSMNLSIARASQGGFRSKIAPRMLMRLLAKSQNMSGVATEFSKLEKPNLKDFNILIDVDVPAEVVLPELHRRGHHPDGETFGALAATVYRRRGVDTPSLQQILTSMMKMNIAPTNAQFLNSLMGAAVSQFDKAEFEHLLSFLRERVSSARPWSEICLRALNALIRSAVDLDRLFYARKIIHEYVHDDASHEKAMESLAFGYLRMGDVERASNCLGEIRKVSKPLKLALKRGKQLRSQSTGASSADPVGPLQRVGDPFIVRRKLLHTGVQAGEQTGG